MIIQLYPNNGPVEVDFKTVGHAYKVNGDKKTGVTTITGLLNKPDLLPWAAYMAAEAFKAAVTPWATTAQKMTKAELNKLSVEAKKAHTRKSGLGKDVGTIVHEWIKEEISNNLKPMRVPTYTVSTLMEIEQQIIKTEGSKRMHKVEEVEKLKADALALRENTVVAQHCIQEWRKFVVDYGIHFQKTEFIVYSKKLDYCGTVDGLMYSTKLGNKVFINDYKTSKPQQKRNSYFQIVGHKPYPEHFVQMAGYDYAHHEETGISPDGYMIVYLPKEGPYQVFVREEVAFDREGWANLVKSYNWLQDLKGAR